MKKKIISQFSIRDIKLLYVADELNRVGILLIPEGTSDLILWDKAYQVEPLIQVKLSQDAGPFGFSQGRTMRNSASVDAIAYVGQKIEDHEVVTELQDLRGYRYFHHMCWNSDSEALECFTVMENRGSAPVTVEMLSSFTLGGMTPYEDGLTEAALVLHQILSTWSAEGRLVSHPVEELQLEPSWQKYSANTLRFGQVGSMPVRQYAPHAAVEDRKRGVTWAVALSHASSWQIEAYRRDDCLVLSGGLADRELGQWFKCLQPGEVFCTPKAVLTVVKGGPDRAFGRLAENMRSNLALPETEAKLPVIFNEFCTTWGCPSYDRILAMADSLKGRHISYFIIDAGWFDSEAFDERVSMGEWKYNPDRFPHGMKAAADAIRERGMIPGIWFEFEISGADSVTFQWLDHLLTRDGIPITSGKRRFFDMRQEWVQAYLAEKVIDFLKDNGFGYIKVDYNETIGIGCDGAESLGEGLRQQILGTQQFFCRIREALPEIVIENCSSGGHRLVSSFMELVSMASFSDAHECDEIPILAANMHRMILPRQSQIWAVLKKDNPLKKFYYQMASTFLGRCCISGDVTGMSGEQWHTVEEGIDFYKAVAAIIDCGVSEFYGPHMMSYRKPKGWQGVVRSSREGKQILVVLHTFHDSKKRLELPLPQCAIVQRTYVRAGIKVEIKKGPEAESRTGSRSCVLSVSNLDDFDGLGILLRSGGE